MPQKDNKPRSLYHHGKKLVFHGSLATIIISSLIVIILVSYLFFLDKQYEGKVYPGVFIGNTDVSGKTQNAIIADWETRNRPYKEAQFEFKLDDKIATISGSNINLGYDSALVARQAYLVGRSGTVFSNIFAKLFRGKTLITPYFRWDKNVLADTLEPFKDDVDVAPQDALFQFDNGKVTTFKPAQPGKRLNVSLVESQLEALFPEIPTSSKKLFTLTLNVDHIEPNITTAKANNYGIKERIGHGYSEFQGSIPGRIKNVELAASKMHGVLIAPGEIISYNKIIGDISAATGWAAAYIIKDGRTVLGDGGGVCQGSTTLFRAAMDAGLPILERSAHAYRVHYYEEGGFKPGIDATVFAPSVDLKIKNDTPGYILIQSTIDLQKLTLAIDIYGTSDGRKGQVLDHQILSQSPPPPALYQDDPTLPKGVTKQVDWSAPGAKTVFTYKVTRGNEVITNQQFVSNFRPWQAVYLVGTM